jgi:hypothetical protein
MIQAVRSDYYYQQIYEKTLYQYAVCFFQDIQSF